MRLDSEVSLLGIGIAVVFDKEVLPTLKPGTPSLDDVELMPTLRNATCIPGLVWPAATKKYVEETCAAANVATYF